MMPALRKIAVIIPARNEELLLAKTLQRLREILPAKDIYVVSDDSEDETVNIGKRYTNNVLNLSLNMGKADALNLGMEHFKLPDRYRYIMPLDADTLIDKNFIREALKSLKRHPAKKKACAVGRVTSKGETVYGYFRSWEYEVVHAIYKSTTSRMQAMVVCPGCATIYSSRIFRITQMPSETMAEDMDLTFTIHRRHLGVMVYAPDAVVVTIDPYSLSDYMKQLHRWYVGFWQSVLKHNIPWGGQLIDVEVTLLAIEGLFNGLFVMLMLSLLPVIIYLNRMWVVIPILLDLMLFMLPSMIYTMIRRRQWKMLFYLPHFYLLRSISGLLFVRSFVHVVLRLDELISWFSPRRLLVRRKY